MTIEQYTKSLAIIDRAYREGALTANTWANLRDNLALRYSQTQAHHFVEVTK